MDKNILNTELNIRLKIMHTSTWLPQRRAKKLKNIVKHNDVLGWRL